MIWGRLLCRLGVHHWDFWTEVDMGWVFDFAWCQRHGCRYEEPMLVNRELSLAHEEPPTAVGGPPQQL